MVGQGALLVTLGLKQMVQEDVVSSADAQQTISTLIEAVYRRVREKDGPEREAALRNEMESRSVSRNLA